MSWITAFVVSLLAGMTVTSLLKGKSQKIALFLGTLLMAIASGVPAWQALTGKSQEWIYPGNIVTGEIPLRIDALSAWFIFIISFIFITGIFYGFFYLKPYARQRNNLTIHYISFLLLYGSLIGLTVIQNSLVFLTAWEIMTLSAFMVVIFEHQKEENIKAGINFLIQSHISVLFLMTGFIWAAIQSGSYDFHTLTTFASGKAGGMSIALMICFIIGFGIKAGFVPFHTWLPYAHPAAPAHISGIMSGVIIKIGIFGILRMLLLIPVDYMAVGYLLLAVSFISGLYGVMLAIVQHNLKKLLAYHSVENIGIIGLGMGLGCIGLGTGNPVLASLGFAGALLHTLNHALFKSLLFYASGIVYQATHTLNIEHLGGLIKKMPQTAALFLVAAIAICGIPPFNGFISEFIIYSGLYQWIIKASLVPAITALVMILGLVLIGGLALLCFTKAFGIVFLGSPRKPLHQEIREAHGLQLAPLYLTAFLITLIGIFPQGFLKILNGPVGLLSGNLIFEENSIGESLPDTLQSVSLAMWGLILLTAAVYFIRKTVMKRREVTTGPTWGCGYAAPTPKLQYTAGSFVRTYSKLNSPTLLFSKHRKEITGIFPEGGHYESHAYDKIEKWLIDKPVRALKSFLSRFLFIQNGRLQFYLLYGILFILALIFIPMIINLLKPVFEFLKNLVYS